MKRKLTAFLVILITTILLLCSAAALALAARPVITGISPDTVTAGALTETITGSGFTGVRSVAAYNAATGAFVGTGTFRTISSTKVVASGVLNPGTYFLKVATIYGLSNASPKLTVVALQPPPPPDPVPVPPPPLPSVLPTANFCLDGNSFTYGTEEGATPYWTMDGRFLINCKPTFNCIAVGYASTPNLIANDPANADRLINGSYNYNIYIAWDEILADVVLNNASPTVAATNLVNLYLARKAAGWKTVVATMMPTGYYTKQADFEDRRTLINNWIRGNWQTFADALADPASDPIIGQADAWQNPVYYEQVAKTHLTTAGNIVAAKYFAAAVNSILARSPK